MKKISRMLVILCLAVITIVVTEKTFIANAANYNTESLSVFEEQKLDELVLEKLNIADYSYEVITGLNYDYSYVLVEGNNSYLIYDRELLDYLEYSTETNSIYFDLDSDFRKYYLGPTYYLSVKNNEMIDLYDNKTLSLKEIENYKLLEKEIKENCITNKQVYEKRTEKDIVIMNSAPSTPIFIPYDFYFENLILNVGTNTTIQFTGSCSYVALGMLLSYYDTIVNDNVIDESRDVTAFNSFSSSETIKTSDYTQSPGINDTFHAELINLGRSLKYTNEEEFSISLSKMDDLLKNYFNTRNLNITTHNTGLFTNKLNFCKQAINSNNPVIIQIKGTDTSIDDRNLNHAVVGYGYDSTGIFVNFGWRNRNNSKVNIHNYTIADAFYIELNEEHICSNNYRWTHNGCTGTVCPCGSKTCNHICRSFVKYNLDYHKNQCDGCGSYYLVRHNFYEKNGFNVCDDCGYSIATDHRHVFLYKSRGDGRTHNAICSCGYSQTEACIGMVTIGGTASCSKCKQLLNSGGSLLSLLFTEYE